MPILRQKPLEDPRLSRLGQAADLGGGAPAATGGASSVSPQGPVPQGVGSFVNLQQYLAANQGQGSGMADKAFGGVEQQANALQDPGLQARADTMAAAGDRSGIDAMNAGAQKVGQQAGLAGSWGGRDTQLAQTYGKGAQYSQGERNLDNALMGGEAGNRLSQLSSRYSGLANKLFTPTPAPAPVAAAAVPSTPAKPKPDAPVIRSTYGQNKVDDENTKKSARKTGGGSRVNAAGYDY